MYNTIYEFCVRFGLFAQDFIVPFLAVCVLFRLYVFLGWKNKSYARGVKFYDTFVTNLAEQFKDVSKADIINFKKEKENEN